MEGLKVSDDNLIVYVEPMKSTKVSQAVLRELNSLLFKREGSEAYTNIYSCHCFGLSSAVITDEDVRKEFKYKAKYGEELYASRSHKRHVIKVGTMIRFLVKSFHVEKILHIFGSLVPTNTGSIRWLAKHMEDVPLIDRSTKKRGESEGE